MAEFDVIVIGGGASGCMAGIYAGRNGANVLVIERNEKLGKKLFITGKGRCNLTNNSDINTHLTNTINGKKFLNSAIRSFSPEDCINFFESLGLKLKTERGNRVFPESDKSSDVIKVLEKELKENAKIMLNTKVLTVFKKEDKYYIKCGNNLEYTTKCVVIATGGFSYTTTGSDGNGHNLARKFNHSITDIKPGLIPIVVKENVNDIEGLSLKNVVASIEIDGKIVASEFGEMLFTNIGVSGPIILTISSKINHLNLEKAKLLIDFKPALDEKVIDQKLIREFNENSNKMLSNYLKTLLPNSIIAKVLEKLDFNDKILSKITKIERKSLVQLIKRFDFSIKMLDNINKAIITSGGVCLDEINPKTMESKLVQGLFFAGEILDADALTGGFNLQIAFSTGVSAGRNSAIKSLELKG